MLDIIAYVIIALVFIGILTLILFLIKEDPFAFLGMLLGVATVWAIIRVFG